MEKVLILAGDQAADNSNLLLGGKLDVVQGVVPLIHHQGRSLHGSAHVAESLTEITDNCRKQPRIMLVGGIHQMKKGKAVKAG